MSRFSARPPFRVCRQFTLWSLLLVLLAAASAVLAADTPTPNGFDLDGAKKAVVALEKARDAEARDDARLSAQIQEAAELRLQLSECSRLAEAELTGINADINAVEAAVGEGSKAAEKELKPLRNRKSVLEGRLAECRLYVSRADALVAAFSGEQSKRLALRLLNRGPDVYALTMASLQDPAQWWYASWDFVRDRSGLRELGVIWFIALGLFALGGWFLGIWLRPLLVAHRQARSEATLPSRIARALVHVIELRLSLLLSSSALSGLLLLLHRIWDTPPSFVASAAFALTGYLWARVVIRGLLVPPPPHQSPLGLPTWLARAFSLRLGLLLISMAAGGLLFLTPLPESLPPHIHDLVRMAVVVVLALNAAWLVWLAGSIPGRARSGRGLRTLMLCVLVASIAGELAGYHNFASYLLVGLSLTLGLFLLAWLVGAVVQDIFDSLDTGRYLWQQRLRSALGLEAEESIPGLIWFRLMLAALTWGLWLLILLDIWGLADAGGAVLLKFLADGVSLGGVRIVPTQVLLGFVIFLVVSTLSRALTRGVEHKVAVQRRMDVGAREALVKVVGYLGFLVAALTGLSVAGVDFSSFAIVAGALSVGIGFGLQNIVNNFVSGLILLFERPIRTGDWIVVDGHEGVVRRISVRSTEIQTFDQADVILPNADLISHAVKNYTLRDRLGRVKCSVGVAYGTDTDSVKRVLLEAANAHPRIIRGGVARAPWVWFRGFGDSSLKFELLGFISDVTDCTTVESDLYFDIERRLREARIEIPFPPRDGNSRASDPALRAPASAPASPPVDDGDASTDVDGGGSDLGT